MGWEPCGLRPLVEALEEMAAWEENHKSRFNASFAAAEEARLRQEVELKEEERRRKVEAEEKAVLDAKTKAENEARAERGQAVIDKQKKETQEERVARLKRWLERNSKGEGLDGLLEGVFVFFFSHVLVEF